MRKPLIPAQESVRAQALTEARTAAASWPSMKRKLILTQQQAEGLKEAWDALDRIGGMLLSSAIVMCELRPPDEAAAGEIDLGIARIEPFQGSKIRVLLKDRASNVLREEVYADIDAFVTAYESVPASEVTANESYKLPRTGLPWDEED